MIRVKDLIAKLSEYPTDAIVLVDTSKAESNTTVVKEVNENNSIVYVIVGD